MEKGRLIIEAKKEDFQESHYTSARLVTRGKGDFTYGRVEVSAKLPVGQGNWPAIWLLGSSLPSVGWPACGEIDIMEHLGRNPGWIHASTHSKKYYFKNGNQLTSITYVPEPHEGFHVYAVESVPRPHRFLRGRQQVPHGDQREERPGVLALRRPRVPDPQRGPRRLGR